MTANQVERMLETLDALLLSMDVLASAVPPQDRTEVVEARVYLVHARNAIWRVVQRTAERQGRETQG